MSKRISAKTAPALAAAKTKATLPTRLAAAPPSLGQAVKAKGLRPDGFDRQRPAKGALPVLAPPALARPPEGAVLRHYTDEAGFLEIQKSGTLRPDARGRVFITPDKVAPGEAMNALFAGNPFYAGKGTHVIELVAREGVKLVPGTQPNELIHQGSLREGRHFEVVYAGPNRD